MKLSLHSLGAAFVAAVLTAAPLAAQATVAVGNVSLAGAKQVMEAAQAYARAHDAPGGAVAIVDATGSFVLRFEVERDGALVHGETFFDMTGAPGEEALDGLKVDRQGNLFSSGPGGVWVISPEGKHLGTLVLPQLPANLAWGDADGRTLYLTARTALYRMHLK